MAANCLEAALDYAARGWAVLPVKHGGKEPLTAHGVKDASTDEATIRAWWAKWSSGSVAIATGPASTLVVLDVDGPEGEASLAALEAKHGKLPPTLQVKTPGDGHHYYFAPRDGQTARCSAGALGPGLDVRGTDGFVVAPPSIHESGKRYEWLNALDLAPLPAWLAAPHAPDPPTTGNNDGGKIGEGVRNSTLTSLAGTMRRRGMTPEAIEAALLAENAARCEPPLPEAEVCRISTSVARYKPAPGSSQEFTEAAARGATSETSPGSVAVGSPQPGAGALGVEEARTILPDILNEIAGVLASYVVVSEAQRDILALWVFHTHVLDAFDRTPYLNVSSAEKRSGKTLLLDLLALLVRNPWSTCNATSAALARKIAEQNPPPSCFIDEADTFIGAEGERAEMLRGILNAGFQRGGKFSRCVGEGSRQRVQDLEVFAPKAIAGLRELPDTVADRSIRVHMERALPGEARRRFRRREVEPIAMTIRARVEHCAGALVPVLKNARPELVVELNDRANDISEPLLAVADLAGAGWPERTRAALLALCGEERDEPSIAIRLLGDLRNIFTEGQLVRIETGALITALCAPQDSPWRESSRGKPIRGHTLARILRRFGIQPAKWWDAKTVRGYERAVFEESWARYLAPLPPENGGRSARTPEPFDSEVSGNKGSGGLALQTTMSEDRRRG